MTGISGPVTPFTSASIRLSSLSGHTYNTESNEEYDSDLGSTGHLVVSGVCVSAFLCTGVCLARGAQQHAHKRIAKDSVSNSRAPPGPPAQARNDEVDDSARSKIASDTLRARALESVCVGCPAPLPSDECFVLGVCSGRVSGDCCGLVLGVCSGLARVIGRCVGRVHE